MTESEGIPHLMNQQVGGDPKYQLSVFTILAVTTISSSSACYLSTLPVTACRSPCLVFQDDLHCYSRYCMSSKSVAVTICFPATSCKVAKHTAALTVVLVSSQPHVSGLYLDMVPPGQSSNSNLLATFSAMSFSTAFSRALKLIKSKKVVSSCTEPVIHF
jgi:hypothetical protein